MKKSLLILLFSLLISSTSTNAIVSPVGFSFISKGLHGQFPPIDWSVYGMRFNVFGAEHKNVVGIDVGGYNVTNELFGGMQLGLFNYNKKTSYIVLGQIGLVNTNVGKTFALGGQLGIFANNNEGPATIIGIQAAIANLGKQTTIYGWQLGVYNRAFRVVGFQFGLVNYADNLHGFQVGLLNMCKSCLIEIMPGINMGF